MSTSTQATRIPKDLLARAGALADRVKDLPDFAGSLHPLTQAAVIRAAIARGLKSLEDQATAEDKRS